MDFSPAGTFKARSRDSLIRDRLVSRKEYLRNVVNSFVQKYKFSGTAGELRSGEKTKKRKQMCTDRAEKRKERQGLPIDRGKFTALE